MVGCKLLIHSWRSYTTSAVFYCSADFKGDDSMSLEKQSQIVKERMEKTLVDICGDTVLETTIFHPSKANPVMWKK